MKINGIQRPQVDTTPGVKRAAPQRGQSPAAKVAVSREAKQLAEARPPYPMRVRSHVSQQPSPAAIS